METGLSGQKATNQSLKKGPWTATEDAVLIDYVKKHGEGNWNSVQKNSGLMRCGKSCRLRWANHLRPNLKKGSFTPEEERIIIELHAKLGNKWARMASQVYIGVYLHIDCICAYFLRSLLLLFSSIIFYCKFFFFFQFFLFIFMLVLQSVWTYSSFFVLFCFCFSSDFLFM